MLNSGIRSLRSEADQHVDPYEVHTSEPEDSGPKDATLDREPNLEQKMNGTDGVEVVEQRERARSE